ncbi:MAG: DUF2061 domain-containing protein [Hyphomonas sp.]|uniref:DUF2061 domain-containing protein n=1 Tax=Hyphomonas sp. TaxID=87 RepID=UPI003002AD3E
MRRELIKTLTYSLMHLCVAVTVAFVLTRDWRIALGVGVIEPMVQTVAYTFHEKAWKRSAGRGFTWPVRRHRRLDPAACAPPAPSRSLPAPCRESSLQC